MALFTSMYYSFCSTLSFYLSNGKIRISIVDTGGASHFSYGDIAVSVHCFLTYKYILILHVPLSHATFKNLASVCMESLLSSLRHV